MNNNNNIFRCYDTDNLYADKDTPVEIEALSFHDASIEYAKRCDEDDYSIVNGVYTIIVVVEKQNTSREFRVYGRVVPIYYSEEIPLEINDE